MLGEVIRTHLWKAPDNTKPQKLSMNPRGWMLLEVTALP
jgi:hypothetical protein